MLRWLFPTFVKGWTPTIFCFAAAPSDSDVEGTFRRQRKRRRAETASARKRRRKGPMPPPDAKPGGQTGHGRRSIIEHLLPADLSNVQVFQFTSGCLPLEFAGHMCSETARSLVVLQ